MTIVPHVSFAFPAKTRARASFLYPLESRLRGNDARARMSKRPLAVAHGTVAEPALIPQLPFDFDHGPEPVEGREKGPASGPRVTFCLHVRDAIEALTDFAPWRETPGNLIFQRKPHRDIRHHFHRHAVQFRGLISPLFDGRNRGDGEVRVGRLDRFDA